MMNHNPENQSKSPRVAGLPPAAARWLTRVVTLALAACCVTGGVALGLSTRTDPLAAERAAVAGLSPTAKDELRQKAERFAQLDAREQESLRKLQRDIQASEDPKKLHDVMKRYYTWLSELTQTQREDLLALRGDVTGRVAKANDIQLERDRRAPLCPEDRRTVAQWHLQVLEARVAAVRPDDLQKLKVDHPNDWQMRLWMLLPREPSGRGPGQVLERFMSKVTDDELKQLSGMVSKEAKVKLDRESTLPGKHKLVEQWIVMAFQRPRMEISKDELTRFFERDLSKEDRDMLTKMPEDQRVRRLRYLYFQSRENENFAPRRDEPRVGEQGPPQGGGRGGPRPGGAGGSRGPGFGPGGGGGGASGRQNDREKT